MTTRSKIQPSAPATATAAASAGAIAIRFSARLGACMLPFIAISTDAAA